MSKHPVNFKHPRQDLTNTLPPSKSHKHLQSQEPVELCEFLKVGDVMTRTQVWNGLKAMQQSVQFGVHMTWVTLAFPAYWPTKWMMSNMFIVDNSGHNLKTRHMVEWLVPWRIPLETDLLPGRPHQPIKVLFNLSRPFVFVFNKSKNHPINEIDLSARFNIVFTRFLGQVLKENGGSS